MSSQSHVCACSRIARAMLGVDIGADQRPTMSAGDDVTEYEWIIGSCWFTASPARAFLTQHLEAQPAVCTTTGLELMQRTA
jgi:hypothetical protein